MRKIMLVISLIAALPINAIGNQVVIMPGPAIGQDTYSAEYFPNENYGNEQEMAVQGYPGGDLYSYLRFTQLDGYIGYEITSAELHVFVTFASMAVREFSRVLGPWDEDTLTWNNQPAHSNHDYVSCYIDEYDQWTKISIDVTEMVQKWLSGEWVNYGWCITDQGGPLNIATSNWDTPDYYRPSLVLVGPNLPPLSVQPTSLGKIKSLYSPQQVSSLQDGRGQFAKHSKREAWATIM
jgi:hypothetical protein